MRSIAALTATLLLALAIWPVHQAPRALGQDPLAPAVQPPETAKPVDDNSTAAIQARLAKKIDVNFDQNPFEDAVRFLAEVTGTNIVIDQKSVEDEGTDLSQPVTLKLKSVTPTAVLRQLLEPLSLDYAIRDGVVRISTATMLSGTETQVYNCRDLLPPPWTPMLLKRPGTLPAYSGGFGGQGGFFDTDPNQDRAVAEAAQEEKKMEAAEPKAPDLVFVASSAEGEALITLITTTVAPHAWGDVGGPGTISEFKGLLVVRQSPDVHRKIQALLDNLRAASSEQIPAPHPDDRAPAKSAPPAPTP